MLGLGDSDPTEGFVYVECRLGTTDGLSDIRSIVLTEVSPGCRLASTRASQASASPRGAEARRGSATGRQGAKGGASRCSCGESSDGAVLAHDDQPGQVPKDRPSQGPARHLTCRRELLETLSRASHASSTEASPGCRVARRATVLPRNMGGPASTTRHDALRLGPKPLVKRYSLTRGFGPISSSDAAYSAA